VLAREHVSDAAAAGLSSVRVGGHRIELPYHTSVQGFSMLSARLAADTFDSVGDKMEIELAGDGLIRADEPRAITLTMDGFSPAYAKLQSSCEKAPPAVQSTAGTSIYNSSANPNCSPGRNQLQCLQGLSPSSWPSAQSSPLNALPSANVVHSVPIKPEHTQTSTQPPPAPASRPSSAVIFGWHTAVVSRLVGEKRYPPEAKGEQGTAKLVFRIDRSGHLVESRIVQSSGSAVLDQETLALVERAQPFPTPPADISDAQLSFVVPMHYVSPRQVRQ
jgi:TonB family protein